MKLENKKGFTLIELIGVIVIIALLALLITPVVTSVINNSKEKLYQNTLKNIELSAKDWFSDEENMDKLPKNFETCYINLSELKDAGIVDKDIRNPKTDTPLSDELINIIITKNANSYNYEIKDDGTYSGSPCSKIVINSNQPTLSATNYQGYKKTFNLAISYSNLKSPDLNNLEYYVSSSSDSLTDGEWRQYSSGVAQTIGTSLNGTYYVFVKRLFNFIDGEYYYSTYGGIIVKIDDVMYQRFGPYQFDNKKPTFAFYSKSNTNDFGDNALQKLNYAYNGDTVKITFRGTDANYYLSNLTIDNINIFIDSIDVTSNVTSSLSAAKSIENGVEYTLTIQIPQNLPQSGNLRIVIAKNTIVDKAGNKNNKTTIDSKIKINECPYSIGKSYTFKAGTNNTFYAPCTGTYQIELAGAKGGNKNGGAGAIVSGNIYLARKTKLSVVVGSAGGKNIAGYNGGGIGFYGGGGSTDVRIGGTSLANRIMVAGGGGGGGNYAGGSAGGLIGLSAQAGDEDSCTCSYSSEGSSGEETTCSKYSSYSDVDGEQKTCVARYAAGGTQSSGGSYSTAFHFTSYIGAWTGYNGSLGQGGNSTYNSSVGVFVGGGGGGGYYGGGGGTKTLTNKYGGGGGSSYISGMNGYADHSSGYKFTGGSDSGINTSDGYAIITLLST